MKRISVIIAALLIGTCCTAQHRAAIGTDLGSMIRNGIMNLSAGYGFKERWSVTWKTGIGIGNYTKDEDSEYNEHLSEFVTPRKSRKLIKENCISIQYWFDKAYDGAYLETGCRSGTDIEADCTIGAGYCIHIWKGLTAVLSYETDLLDSFNEDKPTGPGLSIGLRWVITK